MSGGFITTFAFPAALAVIMLGLGLSLTTQDFRRVMKAPKVVGVALACQVLILPVACVGVAHGFQLSPELAVGLMLLAASPGGTSANLFSHLADGDVALNISLTAINSVLAIITLPIVVNLSLQHFMGDDQSLPLQFGKVIQVFVIVLVPVVVGMIIRRKLPGFADAMAPIVKKASVVFLFAVIAVAVITDWDRVVEYAPQVGAASLCFNLISLGVGYSVPRLLNISRRQATAIGMEIGIHNSVLAITIAMSPLLLNNPTMATPAAIYGLIANFTAAAFGFWVGSKNAKAGEVNV